MKLPPAILATPGLTPLLALLEAAGHRALIVGGAVRNGLLGQRVEDIDLATDARPERVAALAETAGLRVIPTGIEHGTVTVISHGHPFEITTFRRDISTDGRRATVAFTDALEEDAARRDFTMNALYADAAGRVIDPVGGLPDLAARRLRFVGEPAARIAEDYLRILRFFRFHAHYGAPGGADAAALAACRSGAPGLTRISAERIGTEMRKLLAAPDPTEALALMEAAGVLPLILPGARVAPVAALIAREGDTPPDWRRRLAALGGEGAAERLRLSRAEARHLAQLADAAAFSPQAVGYRYGPDLARDAMLLREDAPPDWPARIAAARPLPIAPADLAPLTGAALGQGLRAAEGAWIASDFTASRQALIAAGLATAPVED